MNNLFETVKSAVSVPKAAAFYGLNADHSGMIRCLFHPDHNPSMKLYDDHFYVVTSIHAGDDPKAVSTNAGHYSVAFTLDRYGYFMDSMRKESSERMEQFRMSL